MTIISKIAKERLIERLIRYYEPDAPCADDLSQDLYVDLINKPSSLITSLYDNNALEFYIRKMVKNNLRSLASPYYKKYIKFKQLTDDITDDTISAKCETQAFQYI